MNEIFMYGEGKRLIEIENLEGMNVREEKRKQKTVRSQQRILILGSCFFFFFFVWC